MKKSTNNYIQFIKSRRSIRNFIFKKIEKETLEEILECGRWTPSGLNNQPWKVNVVDHPTIKRLLAETTKYGEIINSANYNLVVFLDLKKGYNRIKDIQAIGAFMQNILLGTHAMGLGAVWIGEILNNKEKVNEIFKLDPEEFELMGVIALGVIDEELALKNKDESERRPLEDFVEYY